MKLLLDTHILVWWVNGAPALSKRQGAAVARIAASRPALIADITLWEIAMLCAKGRLRLSLPLRDWLDRATAPPLVERCGITPAVAAAVVGLPPTFHADPADRIIVATALVHGATLVTSDRRIIDSGIVTTVA